VFANGKVEENENYQEFETERQAEEYVLNIFIKYEMNDYNEALANGDTDPDYETMEEWFWNNTMLEPEINEIVEP
jgi:hypothetical protein